MREAIAAQGLARSHLIVLDALLKLRQICCDPRLLKRSQAALADAFLADNAAGNVKFSAKDIEALFEPIPSALAYASATHQTGA